MKNIFFLYTILLLALVSCKSRKVQLRFLDEYVYTDTTLFKNTKIGGLSGIDYVNDTYYIVSDDSKNPRFLTAKIKIEDSKIANIRFTDVILLNTDSTNFYKTNYLDLESILYDFELDKIVLSTEGSINKNKNPLLFSAQPNGTFYKNHVLPELFSANSSNKPRNNGVFEGLSRSADAKGYWLTTEVPLEKDGEEPKYGSTNSPVRFLYFDKYENKVTKEFAYLLESLPRPKKGMLNTNGLTDILEYKPNHFFVIERTYQSGYTDSNIVKIFKAIIHKEATNTLGMTSLKKASYVVMKKELLFDFEQVRGKLTRNIIDNIEGISFGPKLSNGNQSLLLISDNNFQEKKQINQFLLLEIIEK